MSSSISCTQVLEHSTGYRTFAGGPKSSHRSFDPEVGSTSGMATRCSTHSTMSGMTSNWLSLIHISRSSNRLCGMDDTTYLGSGRITHSRTNEWNHGLGEIINALIIAGLRIDAVREHRAIEWQALPSMSEKHGRYQLPDHQRDLVPLEFSIAATKD